MKITILAASASIAVVAPAQAAVSIVSGTIPGGTANYYSFPVATNSVTHDLVRLSHAAEINILREYDVIYRYFNCAGPGGTNCSYVEGHTVYLLNDTTVTGTQARLRTVVDPYRWYREDGGSSYNYVAAVSILGRSLVTIQPAAGRVFDRDIDFWSRTIGFALVPEPATWALMLAGFGAIGGMMRRRRPERPLAACP